MLGANAYIQVSSPIRRFADMLFHQQIKSWLTTGRPLFSASELMEQMKGVEDQVRKRLKVERERHRHWVLVAMERRGSSPLRAQVVRKLGKRFLVSLLEWGIRETASLPQGTQVGDFVQVRSSFADPTTGELKLIGA